MYKYSLMFLLLFFSVSAAQSVIVTDEITVNTGSQYAHAQYIDNSTLILTKDNYTGLWKFNLNDESLSQITDKTAAGYKYSVDGNEIAYRSDNFVNGKRYSAIVKSDLAGTESGVLASEMRNATPPVILPSGKIVFLNDTRLTERGIAVNSEVNDIAVLMQEFDMAVYQNGSKRIFKPLGDERYLWASLSPQKDRMLFTAAGKGTFIADLQGNILADFGYANAPQWSPDGNFIVYMKDYDDNREITASDIYVAPADASAEYAITNTDNRIELYPAWSPDGTAIVFNTLNGEIIITKLEIN